MKYDYSKKLYKLFLCGVYDGATFDEIIGRETQFGVKPRNVRAALGELVAHGKIEKRGEKYLVSGDAKKERPASVSEDKIVGVLRVNERGFGFITVEGDKDYYVAAADICDALNGDEVEAVKTYGRGTGDAARIVKVIKHGKQTLVGVLFTEGAFYYVRPDDRGFLTDIFIPEKDLGGAIAGDKVFVTITSFPKRRCPDGKVTAVLGRQFLMETEEKAVILSSGLRTEFPAEVADAASRITQKVPDNALIGRLDLENELIFTIDGDSAKDFDDAVSLKKTDGGNYLLGVHIADVSEYVTKGSALDNEAFERGTSVYFPDLVVPMLPFELSDGICSLVEGERRLTLSAFIEIDGEGNVVNSEFFRSFIRSRKRLTYNMADELFAGSEIIKEELGEIADSLFEMKKLSEILKRRRGEAGYIDLDVKESDISVENGKVEVSLHRSTAATELIEQFMITANEEVAVFLFDRELPCIYRIHEKPLREKTEFLREFTAALGIKFSPRRDECYPGDIRRLLSMVEGKDCAAVVNKTVLRSLQKAKYSTENLGHFGLASKCYCHFTSPIRRYPDLNVHRALKDAIDGSIYGKIDLYADFFAKAAEKSSEMERRAEEAERAMDDLFKIKYLEDRIGEKFDGVICGVVSGGVFVALENGCELFCPVDVFPAGEYEYDRDGFSLRSKRFDFSIGKSVGVVVLGADYVSRRAEGAFTDLGSVKRFVKQKSKKSK